MPPSRNLNLLRSRALLQIRRQLEQDSYPRLQMGLIVALTGATGLLCSFLLLHAGVHSMTLRYPLALAGAYAVFLLLLWLWLRTKAADYDGLSDLADLVPTPGSGGGGPSFSGGGGGFGGGGASGSFDGPGASTLSESSPLSSLGDAAAAGADADELLFPILVAVFAIGIALASLYVVYLAPALFSELLFDGLLSYTLYRRLRTADSGHWLGTAFRRTALPFGLTALFLVAAGAAMTAAVPGAHSVGEVMHPARVSK